MLVRKFVFFAAIVAVHLFLPTALIAGGISVDAGLTPGQDRWIFKLQARYLESGHDPTPMDREMKMYAYPFMLAYGLRPELTVMVRQAWMRREMEAMAMDDSWTGRGDFLLLTKYRLYRANTSEYTLGIAPTLGLEAPSGERSFTSDTWDLHAGIFLSLRSGPAAFDGNVAYVYNGFIDAGADIEPGDELNLDLAWAYQFGLGEGSKAAVAPVLELSFQSVSPHRDSGHEVPDTGGNVLLLSPGVKFTTSWLILEGLVQFPVGQNQRGDGLERGISALVGTRIMF